MLDAKEFCVQLCEKFCSITDKEMNSLTYMPLKNKILFKEYIYLKTYVAYDILLESDLPIMEKDLFLKELQNVVIEKMQTTERFLPKSWQSNFSLQILRERIEEYNNCFSVPREIGIKFTNHLAVDIPQGTINNITFNIAFLLDFLYDSIKNDVIYILQTNSAQKQEIWIYKTFPHINKDLLLALFFMSFCIPPLLLNEIIDNSTHKIFWAFLYIVLAVPFFILNFIEFNKKPIAYTNSTNYLVSVIVAFVSLLLTAFIIWLMDLKLIAA